MKRFAAGLAALALLWLAPLAHADITYYVNAFSGNASDSDSGGNLHGTSDELPWKTLQRAMTWMRQPNSTNGNIILRIKGHPVQEYNSSINFNPVNKPIDGKRYYIYGDLSDSSSVKIDAAGSTATVVCSTGVTVAGVWFKDGFTFSDLDRTASYRAIPAGAPTSVVLDGESDTTFYTRWRMRDTLRNCRITGTLTVNASNTTTANILLEVGTAGNGSVRCCTNDGKRRRGVDNHFYAIDASAAKTGSDFFKAGGRGTNLGGCTGCPPNPAICPTTDSCRVWFSTFRGTIPDSTDGELGGLTIYNCQNLNLRGNHWNFLQSTGTTSTNLAQKIRDSTTLVVNCDTMVVTGALSGTLWFMNGIDYNQHLPYSVDSSYYQIFKQEWALVSGSWTYTTFVTATGFDYRSSVRMDSLSQTVFNHCNFIETTGNFTVVGPIPYDAGGSTAPFYTWPVTINDGTVMTFKNNIICRAPIVADAPATTSGRRTALVRWGLVGGLTGNNCGTPNDPCPNQDVARKITTNWNLYATNNKVTGGQAGNLSIGWRDFNNFADSTSLVSTGLTNRFKVKADAAAAGTAAAAASSYDSLSKFCHPMGIGWNQWSADSSAIPPRTPFDYVWTQGTILDLNLGRGSVARAAGESGTDIGAVGSVNTSQIDCVAQEDSCNIIVYDYSKADTVVSIRVMNNGVASGAILSPISYSPFGTYTASSTGLTLAAGQSGYLTVRITDAPTETPIGTYRLDLLLPTTDAGDPYLRLTVTIYRQTLSVDD